MERRNAELDEYLRALEGLDYPTSRSAILNRAADTGGLDTEVLRVFERLPDRTFRSADEVLEHVRRDETAFGPSPAPAAPSALDDRDKNLVKEMADPRRSEPFTGDGDEGDSDRRALT